MKMPGASDIYVAARRILLDALEALQEHLDALILVGAQAIYFYTGEADVAIATTTNDSDVLVNPNTLPDDPLLEEAMAAAGFHLNLERRQPGEWLGEGGIAVDLLVPEALGSARPNQRGARIPPHDKMAARNVHGLEAAIVDHEQQLIESLEPERDDRRFLLNVAGPSALLIAKLHKIGERQAKPLRLNDKDAHDIYRLLRAVETDVFVSKLPVLLKDELAGNVTAEALDYLRELFAEPDDLGSTMAGRAEEGVGDPAQVATAVSALVNDLLNGIGLPADEPGTGGSSDGERR